MNTIGIALAWCALQVTLIGVLAACLYLIVRRIRPAAAASVVLAGLAIVVVLSLLVMSPWPRWTIHQSPADYLVKESELNAAGTGDVPTPTDFSPVAGEDRKATTGSNKSVSTKTWPSVISPLWQSLLKELTKPRTAASTDAWRWPTVIAALFIVAMAFGLGRLILGVMAMRRERLRSRPVQNRELLELVEVLRAELNCRRPVEIRQSDDLATAAMIGWRSPLLLLPTNWTTWTADQRRAVLAHEIAHARNHDVLALLFGQLGLVLHFYNPMLHWLMNRLRLEQELAADAAAASISGGPWKYLTTIAELALHQQNRPLSWPARTFLPTQTMFLRRIAMLRNSKPRFDRLSPAVRLMAIGAVLLCGLLVAGIRGPEAQQPALAEEVATTTDLIDNTFITDNADGIIVMRPSAISSQPELAELKERLRTSFFTADAPPLTDFRQVTSLIADLHMTPWEVTVLQWKKPLVEAYCADLLAKGKYKLKGEYNGKKLYVDMTCHDRLILQYDDYTVIESDTEEELEAYFAGKRSVLPKWLPTKAWNSFMGDQFVVAVDMVPIQHSISEECEYADSMPWNMAASATFSPLWKDSLALAVGAKLDNQLEIHAWTATRSAKSSEEWRRAAEAFKVFAQSAIKNTQAAPVLDIADCLLENLKFEQTEHEVRMETSVAFDKVKKFNIQALPYIVEGRQAAQRTQARTNMYVIALAMHKYTQANGHFPPAVLYGPDGKTPYSWRVALLPYLPRWESTEGAGKLYKQYHFNEPWDGPNNVKLLEKMPAVFRNPQEPTNAKNTSYFVLTGPGAIFDGKEGTVFHQIKDGAQSTILVVEAKQDIPWTKPEDIPYDPDKQLPKLGGYFDDSFIAAMADGSVHHLSDKVNQKVLHLLITKADGQPANVESVTVHGLTY